jgi:crossover junction endodeoxyribonuclease RusA
MIITLTGEPQSTNNIYKAHCKFGYPTIYMTAAGKTLKEDYQWQAKSQWKAPIIEKEDVHITIKLFFGRKGKHDIDNYGKLLLDSLTGIVWEDDSQIIKMTVIKWYDKENPRIEVDIL